MLPKLVKRQRSEQPPRTHNIHGTQNLFFPACYLPEELTDWMLFKGVTIWFGDEGDNPGYPYVHNPIWRCEHQTISDRIDGYVLYNGLLRPVFRVIVDCRAPECDIPF